MGQQVLEIETRTGTRIDLVGSIRGDPRRQANTGGGMKRNKVAPAEHLPASEAEKEPLNSQNSSNGANVSNDDTNDAGPVADVSAESKAAV